MQDQIQFSSDSRESALATNKVLRNTYAPTFNDTYIQRSDCNDSHF